MRSLVALLLTALPVARVVFAWPCPSISANHLRSLRIPSAAIPSKYSHTTGIFYRTTALAATSDEDDDDDEPPDVDVANFKPPTMSFGINSGRSSPSQRKAMGRSSSSTASIHICMNCGSEFVKWMGRCPTCKEWNTLQEHAVTRQAPEPSNTRPVFSARNSNSWLDNGSSNVYSKGNNVPVRMTEIYNKTQSDSWKKERLEIPDDQELNNVLGGGIHAGSLTLIGGEPGVGKSTLLLQTAAKLASLCQPTPGIGMGKIPVDGPGPVWYVSGEETPEQIASRAARLGMLESELFLLSETHADSLCEMIVRQGQQAVPNSDSEDSISRKKQLPSLVVIDSIQTMVCDAGGPSAAGGLVQVRECVALFLRLSKSTNVPVVLVGHVTKSGSVAGPRTVEHMVDCVLYLEGSALGGMMNNIRILRASKNRFGSTDEVGVYEMSRGQLLPVSDPSSLFLAHRASNDDMDGCATAIALEGRRAIAVEVQALATLANGGSSFGRRTVDGIANSRLLLLLGVLQKRCGVFLSRQDVYVNVVGRMRLDRGGGNAADLAVAVALVSSLSSIAVRSDTAFVGEIGLLGELRSVAALDKRIQEARRMGFQRIITSLENPKARRGTGRTHSSGIEWVQCSSLMEAINAGLVQSLPRRGRRRSKEGNDAPSSSEQLEIIDDEDDEYDAFM